MRGVGGGMWMVQGNMIFEYEKSWRRVGGLNRRVGGDVL
jgi:hypothetical protein